MMVIAAQPFRFTDNISRFNYTRRASSILCSATGPAFPAYGTNHFSYSTTYTVWRVSWYLPPLSRSFQSKCSKFNWIHKRTHFLHAASLHSFLFIFYPRYKAELSLPESSRFENVKEELLTLKLPTTTPPLLLTSIIGTDWSWAVLHHSYCCC